MNDNYTIPAFAEPITELPDTPSLTAAELKRRFQAPADEVRLAHNALAECVEGITSATYPDTVTEDMLTDALADKINGKADAAVLEQAIEGEAAAREADDAALSEAQTALTTSVAQKCEIYVGTYTGNNAETRIITLPQTPKMVYLCRADGYQMTPNASNPVYGGIALTNAPLRYDYGSKPIAMEIVENGFSVRYEANGDLMTNSNRYTYYYFALA